MNATIPLIQTNPSNNDNSWLKQGKDSSNCAFCHPMMAFAIIRYFFRHPEVALGLRWY
jgi:hypothetical protein